MILLGDCLERLKELEDNSVDSVVTDPPYGLKFMGKKWDYDVPKVALWTEVFRVLKPGGHLLAFGGTRTYHRLTSAIEDAGFEIRDQLQWLYGSGFPKSHSIDKAIDKLMGAEREVIGYGNQGRDMKGGNYGNQHDKAPITFAITQPKSPEAYRYKGWGTALKPANEPIVLARKPLEKGLTVAENMLKWGVGGLNIDESRIAFSANEPDKRIGTDAIAKGASKNPFESGNTDYENPMYKQGRWPANLLLDETAAQMLDEQSGNRPSRGKYKGDKGNYVAGPNNTFGFGGTGKDAVNKYANEQGGASRFFYVAKASKRERNAGLEGMVNGHPTIKPQKLMEYLCKLITPPGGLILDPFCGSGSTLVAAKRLGFEAIGIEMNEEYCEIAEKRIAHASSDE